MTAGRGMARGDVILVQFPFTDLSATRLRPAVIVGRVSGDDLILAFITSQITRAHSAAEHLLDPAEPSLQART